MRRPPIARVRYLYDEETVGPGRPFYFVGDLCRELNACSICGFPVCCECLEACRGFFSPGFLAGLNPVSVSVRFVPALSPVLYESRPR